MYAPDTQSALHLTNTIVALREAQQSLGEAKDVCAAHFTDLSILNGLITRASREKDVCDNGIRSLLSVLSDLNGRNEVLSEGAILAGSELRNTELQQSSLVQQSEGMFGELEVIERDIIYLEARKQELLVQVQNARREVKEKVEESQEKRRAYGSARLELGRARGADDRSKLDGAQLNAMLK